MPLISSFTAPATAMVFFDTNIFVYAFLATEARKRIGKPQDLDAVLVMLASGESHFVNGAVIAADDGFGA